VHNKKAPNKLTLYLRPPWQVTVAKAAELAEREGKSLSQLIIELLEPYVAKHYPGNPQRPLTLWIQQQPPTPMDPHCECARCGAHYPLSQAKEHICFVEG